MTVPRRHAIDRGAATFCLDVTCWLKRDPQNPPELNTTSKRRGPCRLMQLFSGSPNKPTLLELDPPPNRFAAVFLLAACIVEGFDGRAEEEKTCI